MVDVHLILYSEAIDSASYRVTADAASACLTVQGVPAGVSPAAVARLANDTAIAQPVGTHNMISLRQLGAHRLVNLYAAQT